MSLNVVAARAASVPDPDRPTGGGYGYAAPPPPPTTALASLFAFVPTESIVLYCLCIPAAKGLAKEAGLPADGWTWIDAGMVLLLTVLTAAMLGLNFLGRLAAAGPAAPRLRLPAWEMTASSLAFLCWSFAVPGNPFVGHRPELLMTAWFAAVVVSAVLGRVDALMKGTAERPQPPRS